MSTDAFVSSDNIRTMFSAAMSEMYRKEVPQYGTLLELVSDVNAGELAKNPQLRKDLERNDELSRLDVERHGAIRLGKPDELFNMRRLFAVMGMYPVGYYDLSAAGVPVHSTAFRPIKDEALKRNPFRVFTSLLRLELIEDQDLRNHAAEILAKRQIFTAKALELIDLNEKQGGLTGEQAKVFVSEALETFRWHSNATVSLQDYHKLHDAHRLIADVVCFKGPHINHLTPRTLDIDEVQSGMPKRGITPKAVVEGPPARQCPILLRQTSFKALEEPVIFLADSDGAAQGDAGTHTARFGEIEQRGVALSPEGRALYDKLLSGTRQSVQITASGDNANDYMKELAKYFQAFPDSWDELRREGLAFFNYNLSEKGQEAAQKSETVPDLETLLELGYVETSPIIYEDFLPVSAAGIFQSNLGSEEQKNYETQSNQDVFQDALGAMVHDELALYASQQQATIDAVLKKFSSGE